MKGSINIALAAGIIVLIIGAFVGFRYLQTDRTEARLIGTWSQDNVVETLEESMENMRREAGLPPEAGETQVSLGDSDGDENILSGVTLPLNSGESGVAVSLETSIRFEEGGQFTIRVGDRESKGRWVLSNAKGKRKTVVARVMQTPTFEQRLIIHLEFQGKDKMIVADEAGIKSTFTRN